MSKPSPAQILRSVLLDLRLVLLPGTDAEAGAMQTPDDATTYCYVGSMPSEIDQVVLLLDVVGRPGGRTMDTGERHGFPGIRVLVRSLDYSAGYNLAQVIAIALDTKTTKIQTTTPEDNAVHYVQAVTREPNIIHLGEEVGNRRQLFAINARMSFQAQEPLIG